MRCCLLPALPLLLAASACGARSDLGQISGTGTGGTAATTTGSAGLGGSTSTGGTTTSVGSGAGGTGGTGGTTTITTTGGTGGTTGCAPDGQACVVDGDCCGGMCSGGTCGSPTLCPHDLCTVGAKLAPSCDGGCTIKLCAVDPLCCTVAWDQICVNEVPVYCGQPCGGCLPFGGACGASSQCCSQSCEGGACANSTCRGLGQTCDATTLCCTGTCNDGTCAPQMCTPLGSACGPSTPACCTGGGCIGGVCAATSMCPTDGTACGDCVQSKCCAQAAACLASPTCYKDLFCELACVKNGGGLMACFQQCGRDFQTLQAAACAGNSCGAGICI